MDNITSIINSLHDYLGFSTNSLNNYVNVVMDEIKRIKPEQSVKNNTVLGYKTGDQGWYDQIGGGPCDKYCRYTGINPNVQWTCSEQNNLEKLTPTNKNNTGNYCYPYEKTGLSPKNGVVVNGNYISLEQKNKTIDDSGNYNFILYNNKGAKGIENFDNSNQSVFTFLAAGGSNASLQTLIVSNDIWTQNIVPIPKTWNIYDMCALPNGTVYVVGTGNSLYFSPTINPASFKPEPRVKTCTMVSTTNDPNILLLAIPNVNNNKLIAFDINTGNQSILENNFTLRKIIQLHDGTFLGALNQDGLNIVSKNKLGDDIEWIQATDKLGWCQSLAQTPNGSLVLLGKLDGTIWTTPNINSYWTKQPTCCFMNCIAVIPNQNIYYNPKNPPSMDPRWTGPQQTDYMGNDITSFPITQVSDCGNACNKNEDCVGFITNDNADTCWLKSKFENPTQTFDKNAYKMKTNYYNIDNVSLKECENICHNEDNCKGFSYDTVKSTCSISEESVKPSGFNTNKISANKKKHMALNGVYNIYQNNSCVNSTLFDKSPSVKKSLGIIRNDKGIPIIPKQPVCPLNLNNNFIFGKNYEIMALDTDATNTDYLNNLDVVNGESKQLNYSDFINNIKDAKCLQSNSDGSIIKTECLYTNNQKWTYDNNLNTIRNWDGNCLNVHTKGDNVNVSVKPCINDINQKFYLNPVEQNLQPTDYTSFEKFNNLYDKDSNNTQMSCHFDYYILYLIILLILLNLIIKC